MGIGTGIVIMAIGAVMRFAVTVKTDGFNVHTIGLILMGAGAATLIESMVLMQSRGGFNGRRRTTVTETDTAPPPR